VGKLQQECDQAKANAEKAAEGLAKEGSGQRSPLCRQVLRLFLDGRIDDAIKLLDEDELRRTAQEGERQIADAVQAWLLKGCLSTLTFHFEAAQEAYKEALRYLKREADPQLWAETQVEVGGTHAELGIRGEGKAANEHLTDAITAYRNALEVYTRERLPQDWAAVQTNLGNALQAQGLRTGGSQGNELLAQAVAAFRSALEVYSRDRLPQQWGDDPE
jgi:tetratricopeptide (TPR) repeat protein